MKEVVEADCILTHHEAVCVDATTSYVAAVRSLINDHTPEVYDDHLTTAYLRIFA